MAKPDRLSQYAQVDEILWKDRKRYLGLPISFTRYSFDENRFYLRKGFINVSNDEILLYRVLDLTLRRSLGQRIFGVGTIILSTADQTTPTLKIESIKDCEKVYRALSNIVEKERNEKRVLGKEMFGAAGFDDIGSGFIEGLDGHFD
ncbi:PH domain-containing protein [Ruminococcaceae bacterium YRB3002]|nr:PH domain-containing protein [Ruminococcaceae bacterium YRB3002]